MAGDKKGENRKASIQEKAIPSDETFWQMIKRDFRSTNLWKLKILFLLHTAAMMSLFPFLTIHLKAQGITVSETAYIYALTPIAAIIAPPIMGYIADRLGNFNIYLAVLGVIGGLLPLTFLAVPNARDRIYLPTNLTANLTCEQPTSALSGIMCDPKPNPIVNLTLNTCHLNCINNSTSQANLSFQDMTPNISCKDNTCNLELSQENEQKQLKAELLNLQNSAVESKYFLIEKLFYENQTYNSLSCNNNKKLLRDLLEKYGDQLSDVITDEEMRVINDEDVQCQLSCEVNLPTTDICKKPYYVIINDVALSFWLLMLLRVTFGMIFAGYMTLMEGAVITVLGNVKGDLGLQRVWASIGAMAFSPISGLLMDYASRGKYVTDFRPGYILFAVLKCICAGIITQIDLSFKRPSSTVWTDLKQLLKNPQLIMFFAVALFAGINFGYIENFLFWWLEALGAKRSMMGLTVTVGTASGIPWLILSGPIIKKLGHMNVIVIGMLAYAGRNLGYSFIYNPYHALPFEALECLTNSLMMTAFITYINKLATITTIASIFGITIGAMHFGFGRGAGSLVGGLMIGEVGERATFRAFSTVTVIIAVIYFLFYLCWVRPRNTKEENSITMNSIKENNEKDTKEKDGKINIGYEKETPK